MKFQYICPEIGLDECWDEKSFDSKIKKYLADDLDNLISDYEIIPSGLCNTDLCSLIINACKGAREKYLDLKIQVVFKDGDLVETLKLIDLEQLVENILWSYADKPPQRVRFIAYWINGESIKQYIKQGEWFAGFLDSTGHFSQLSSFSIFPEHDMKKRCWFIDGDLYIPALWFGPFNCMKEASEKWMITDEHPFLTIADKDGSNIVWRKLTEDIDLLRADKYSSIYHNIDLGDVMEICPIYTAYDYNKDNKKVGCSVVSDYFDSLSVSN